jgi:zinc/manganese transport system ATP-binding protein
MSGPVVSFNDVTLGYSSHPAIHHLSGRLAAGSMTALLGANGSGKSTLLKGVAGLLKPLDGSIKLADGTRIAYLPQQSELDRSFPARVVDLVSLGLWTSRGLLGRHTAEDQKRVADAIAAVGLTGFEKRPINTLSGGQFQRALFARVLLQDANLILLDEPFNAVDMRTVDHLLVLISAWRDQGRTILTVLHDFDLARRHFPQTLLLARRCVAWGPTSDVLTTANLERARSFDEAWSDDAPWCESDTAKADDPAHEHSHGHGHSHDHQHNHAAE